MNVLVISRGFPSVNDPTSGNFELDQAKSLIKLGHKVVFLCIDRISNLKNRRKIGISRIQEDNIVVYKIAIIPLPLKRYFLKTSLSIMTFLGVILFKRIIKDGFYPDIIHAHYLFNMPIALKIKEKYDIPVIATEHWSLISKDSSRKDIVTLAKKYYPRVDKLISVSKSLCFSIKNISGCNSLVIPNIVDTSCFVYKDQNTLKSDFIFVSVGNLITRKGFDILIKSFSKANFDKNVYLYIVGIGPEYNCLRKLINKLDVQDQVFLLGRKTREEINNIFEKSQVFVLPSHFETFGVVYIEALASGLPVIATSCGGPELFISKDDGLIVPVNDIDALTSSLKYMKQHRNLYDSKQIAKRCVSTFSPDVIGKEIDTVYATVYLK